MLGSVGSLNRLGANGRNVYGPSGASLWLDFTASDTLDSRITFSRGSQATLFDSSGVLRYAKHNLLLQSQTLDVSASWANFSVLMSANTSVAPDGTTTADTMTATATTGTHDIRQTSVSTAGTARTLSIYAKAGTHQFFQLLFGTDVQAYANFNLATGAVATVGTAATASIIDVGNGWYRCVVSTSSATASAVMLFAMVSSGTAARLESWTAAGTETLLFWGAQLNLADMIGGVTESLDTYYPTTTAAFYAGRARDFNPSTLAPNGFLIEEQRTNSIRNNTMQGAVAGSPGTLPTNWGGTGTSDGIAREVVGTGTENGITYIDVKYSGTATATSFKIVRFEAINNIAASSGQTWTAATYMRIAAGSLANITGLEHQIVGYTSGGSVSENTNTPPTLTSTMTRFITSRTLNNATTAFVTSLFAFTFSSGAAIDITLRIGLPQLELGAFATSVIPTSGTALTRNADVASMTGTNFSDWFNAAEGTLLAVAQSTRPAGDTTRIVAISDNTANNSFRLNAANVTNAVVASGNTEASFNLSYTLGAVNKWAIAYKSNDANGAVNGVVGTTDTSVVIPTVDRMEIGRLAEGVSGSRLVGHIQRIAYYPTRLSNAQLQALTT